MLQILKNKKNYIYFNYKFFDVKKNIDKLNVIKFTPSVNEWSNSYYSFNQNKLKFIPVQYKFTNVLLKGYFSIKKYPLIKYKKLSLKKRLLSLKKLFLSSSTIKHSINKIIISLYIYNKEKHWFLKKIQKLNKIMFIKKRYYKYNNNYTNMNYIYSYITNRYFFLFNNLNKILNKFINIKIYNLSYFYKDIKILFNNNDKNVVIINQIEEKLNKQIKRILFYKYYLRMLYNNNYRFNIIRLLGFKNILEKIYEKPILLNIVSLKYFYLNNDIFANIITKKLRDRKKNLLKIIKTALLAITNISINPLLRKKNTEQVKEQIWKNIYSENKYINVNFLNNMLDIYSYNTRNYVYNDLEELQTDYMRFIKYKHIVGVKLEGKGRLTKRLTASRSLFKSKFKGGLKDTRSSFQLLSSILNRNHIKSNIQYTINNSKTRNGSFGLKSWTHSF